MLKNVNKSNNVHETRSKLFSLIPYSMSWFFGLVFFILLCSKFKFQQDFQFSHREHSQFKWLPFPSLQENLTCSSLYVSQWHILIKSSFFLFLFCFAFFSLFSFLCFVVIGLFVWLFFSLSQQLPPPKKKIFGTSIFNYFAISPTASRIKQFLPQNSRCFLLPLNDKKEKHFTLS